MVTRSGKRLSILHPGRWNFQEGPDFRDAILELDGKRVHGDVEIHFHEKDWKKHGHSSNPNFTNVALHVVLFPDRTFTTKKGEENEFETLEWLPYLDRDLESYLDDLGMDLLAGADTPEAIRAMIDLPVETRAEKLLRAARERWDRKCAVALRRVEADGWNSSCHQVFLEVLGLKRNRAVMSRVALEFPVDSWAGKGSSVAAAAWKEFEADWHLAGCRPANHPKRRLESYAAWVTDRGPEWPQTAPYRVFVDSGNAGSERIPSVSSRRKILRLPEAEKRLRSFFSPGVGGTRFHSWITDGMLPLGAARQDTDLFPHWFCWPTGDVPDRIKHTLAELEVTGPGRPLCNGWSQGLLRMLEPDYSAKTAAQ